MYTLTLLWTVLTGCAPQEPDTSAQPNSAGNDDTATPTTTPTDTFDYSAAAAIYDKDGDTYLTSDVTSYEFYNQLISSSNTPADVRAHIANALWDCDDNNANAHPTAEDDWYDGVDSDCLGNDDYDADGDGFTVDGSSSDGRSALTSDYVDCNDGDAAVNPEAEEVCNNGVDDNCDGSANGCELSGTHFVDEAPISHLGDAAGDESATSISGLGDVTGDGIDDIGSTIRYLQNANGDEVGGLQILAGGTDVLTNGLSVFATLWGENDNDQIFAVAPAGDLDEDGKVDLVTSAIKNDAGGTDAGAVYIQRGPMSGDVDLAYASAKLVGGSAYEQAGYALATGDFDDNGSRDVAVGAPGYNISGLDSQGIIFLVDGFVDGIHQLMDVAYATIVGGTSSDSIGKSIDTGDVNGDNVADLVAGAIGNKENGYVDYGYLGYNAAGAVYVIPGPIAGNIDLSNPPAGTTTIYGAEPEDVFGMSVATGTDLDGDGLSEVAAVAKLADPNGLTDVGAGYVFLGSQLTGGEILASEAFIRILPSDLTQTIDSVVFPGDLNNDGHQDLAVNAGGGESSDADNWGIGGYYVFYGPFDGGELSLDESAFSYLGVDLGDLVGTSKQKGQIDINADGISDALTGTSEYAALSGNGAFFAQLGSGM